MMPYTAVLNDEHLGLPKAAAQQDWHAGSMVANNNGSGGAMVATNKGPRAKSARTYSSQVGTDTRRPTIANP